MYLTAGSLQGQEGLELSALIDPLQWKNIMRQFVKKKKKPYTE